MKLEINQLFKHIDNVPQIPGVVQELLSQVKDPNSNMALLAEKVEQEQVISMRILRAVNSSYYSLPQKIGSLKQALIILGIDELKKLIVVSGLVGAIPDIPDLDIEDFWNDNFRIASYAKWIAEKAGIEFSDMIFTAGLFNGLGRILIHLANSKATKDIAQLIKDGHTRPEAEQQYLGFTNQEACAELCRQWLFSEDLIDTISKSAEPLIFEQISLPACTIFIARYISELNYLEKSKEKTLADFPKDEWEKLGLNTQDIEESMTTLFQIETGLEGILNIKANY